jgi:hypothetical protein
MPKNRPRSRAVVKRQLARRALPHDLRTECLQVPQIPQKHSRLCVLQPLDALGFRAFVVAQEQFETAQAQQDL